MIHAHFQKILILPCAGNQNPFQYQMIRFLRSRGFEVFVGRNRKLGSIYCTVKQFDPDIIYFDWIHSYIIGSTFLLTIIKSLFFLAEILYLSVSRKIPIVHTLHNIQNHGGFWLKWERLIYRFFLGRCSKIRVYSETVKQEIIQRFGLLSNVIYIIQDIPYHKHYPNDVSKEESRAHFQIPKDDFVLLFFGKIRSYKGLENLIQIFKSNSYPTDHLLIAGECLDKNYLAVLKKEATNCQRIIWHDCFIQDDEVQYFFKTANVVVLPFTNIDHSGSIDLAMSFGKPVITLKTGATQHLLSHQEDLLFEKPENLGFCMHRAHLIDEEKIGLRNFKIADSSNYEDLTDLFKK